MTRAGGRRAGERPARPIRTPGTPATLALCAVLVVVTAAALALAGRSQPVEAVGKQTHTVTVPAERQLVCPAVGGLSTTYVGMLSGASGGTVSVGASSLDLAPGARQTVPGSGRGPVTVTTTGNASKGVFADRVQRIGGVARCGSPRASWWFTGAGANAAHDSRLLVYNPRPGPAVVDVSVYGKNGEVTSAGLRGIAVPSEGSAALDLADTAPADGDLAVHVQVSRGLVVAAIADHTLDVLDHHARPTTDWLPDQLQPTPHVVLVGLPPPASVDTALNVPNLPQALADGAGLVVSNPGDSPTVVQVRLAGANGVSSPKLLADHTVQPHTVVTIPMARFIKHDGTAIVVDADRPVTAGYVVPGVTDLVHSVPGLHWRGPAAAAVPDIGTSTLTLTADSAADVGAANDAGSTRPATVTVTETGATGEQLDSRQVEVPARSTVKLPLRRGAASVVVTSAGEVVGAVVVERNGSYSSVPLSPVLAALRVPTVRPGSE